MQRLIIRIKKVVKFLRIEFWRISLRDLPNKKAFFIRQQRIFLLTMRGFKDDKCSLTASALTFYSLLSIVPLFAILFGIFKGFGLQSQLELQLLENFPEHETVMRQIIDFSTVLLENTKGGIIAGIGIILLLWSVLKLLNIIEDSLNDIWKINKSRPIVRMLSNYLTIIILAPLFFILSSSLTVFFQVQYNMLTDQFNLLGAIAPITSFLVNLLPHFLTWTLFTLIYMVMPNGKINFKNAFYAAVISGSIYQIAQYLFVTFQIGVANYNAIYGSFSAFPLFLIWLQVSWFIFLFGAEISFASQNIGNYEYEADSKNISSYRKRLMSLAVAHIVIVYFQDGKKSLTSSEIAEKLGMPILLTRNIISEFIETGLFSRVLSEGQQEDTYQPGKDIKLFTIQYVIEALDQKGSHHIPINKTDDLIKLSKTLENFSELIKNSHDNKLVKDI